MQHSMCDLNHHANETEDATILRGTPVCDSRNDPLLSELTVGNRQFNPVPANRVEPPQPLIKETITTTTTQTFKKLNEDEEMKDGAFPADEDEEGDIKPVASSLIA